MIAPRSRHPGIVPGRYLIYFATVWFIVLGSSGMSLAAKAVPYGDLGSEARELLDSTWYAADGEHVLYFGDVKKSVFQYYVTQLERFRFHILQTMPGLAKPGGVPLSIYILREKQVIANLFGAERDGIFYTTEDRDYIFMLGYREESLGGNEYHVHFKEHLLTTLFHEYTHYLMRNASMPVWLDEGMADYLGQTKITEKSIEFGHPSPGRDYSIKEHGLLPLDDLFETQRSDDSYSGEGKEVSQFYATSWAMAHFLLNADDESNANLKAYLADIQGGMTSDDSFMKHFGGHYDALQDKILDYITQPKLPGSRKNNHFAVRSFESKKLSVQEKLVMVADVCMLMEHSDDASSLYDRALKISPTDKNAIAGKAKVLLSQGDLFQAEKLLGKIIQRQEAGAQIHWLYGKTLMMMASEIQTENSGHASKADDFIRLARQSFMDSVIADRGYAPGLHYYGRSHLGLKNESDETGIQALRKALDLQPGSAQIGIDLILLYYQSGAREKAFDLAGQLQQQHRGSGELEELLEKINAFQETAETTN